MVLQPPRGLTILFAHTSPRRSSTAQHATRDRDLRDAPPRALRTVWVTESTGLRPGHSLRLRPSTEPYSACLLHRPMILTTHADYDE